VCVCERERIYRKTSKRRQLRGFVLFLKLLFT
jgi:hypothetical protein